MPQRLRRARRNALVPDQIRDLELLGLGFQQHFGQAGSDCKLELAVDANDMLGSSFRAVLDARPESLRHLEVKYLALDNGENGPRLQRGFDAGGLRRDFMGKVGMCLADPGLGLLIPAEAGQLQLSPVPGLLASAGKEHLLYQKQEDYCRYLGRLLGASVASDLPLGILLVPSLCKALTNEAIVFDDLKHVLGSSKAGSWNQLRRGTRRKSSLAYLDTPAVDKVLDGWAFEVESRTVLVFNAMADGLASSNLAEGALAIAVNLLRQAQTDQQKVTAIGAASKVLLRLVSDALSSMERLEKQTECIGCSMVCIRWLSYPGCFFLVGCSVRMRTSEIICVRNNSLKCRCVHSA